MTRRIPGSIVALLLATAAIAGFQLPIETIGTQVRRNPAGLSRVLPPPHFIAADILPLLPSAFTVALLAAVESLLSAVVADGMSGDHHKSNVELVAQGVANIVSPLFGGMPATGAIARTATNIRSGARTPDRGHGSRADPAHHSPGRAAPLARFVPLATLAAVLFVVAYNMGEWREIGTILRLSKTDISVWITTFALTVLADLTVAVGVGMALAALLYIYRIAETTTVAAVTPEYLRDGQAHILQDKDIPSNVTILRIHGPFLFGTTEKLAEATRDLNRLGGRRDPAPAKHDRARRHRPSCARAILRASAQDREKSSALRSQGSALSAHLAVRLSAGCRSRERLASRSGSTGAGGRDSTGFAGIGRELAHEMERRPL